MGASECCCIENSNQQKLLSMRLNRHLQALNTIGGKQYITQSSQRSAAGGLRINVDDTTWDIKEFLQTFKKQEELKEQKTKITFKLPEDVIIILHSNFNTSFNILRSMPNSTTKVSNYEVACRITQNQYLCKTIPYHNEISFADAFQEVTFFKNVDHYCISRIIQVNLFDNCVSLVQESIKGQNLSDWVPSIKSNITQVKPKALGSFQKGSIVFTNGGSFGGNAVTPNWKDSQGQNHGIKNLANKNCQQWDDIQVATFNNKQKIWN